MNAGKELDDFNLIYEDVVDAYDAVSSNFNGLLSCIRLILRRCPWATLV